MLIHVAENSHGGLTDLGVYACDPHGNQGLCFQKHRGDNYLYLIVYSCSRMGISFPCSIYVEALPKRSFVFWREQNPIVSNISKIKNVFTKITI
jgi:hypothetical protein